MTEVNNNSTLMQTSTSDIPVERIPMPESFSSEPDNTGLYVPKGQLDTTSFQKTRFQLPPNVYGPVRNLAVVYMTESANPVERDRALQQLITMAGNGDEQARAVLRSFYGSGLSLD